MAGLPFPVEPCYNNGAPYPEVLELDVEFLPSQMGRTTPLSCKKVVRRTWREANRRTVHKS